jgi:hypothetical protein
MEEKEIIKKHMSELGKKGQQKAREEMGEEAYREMKRRATDSRRKK